MKLNGFCLTVNHAKRVGRFRDSARRGYRSTDDTARRDSWRKQRFGTARKGWECGEQMSIITY